MIYIKKKSLENSDGNPCRYYEWKEERKFVVFLHGACAPCVTLSDVQCHHGALTFRPLTCPPGWSSWPCVPVCSRKTILLEIPVLRSILLLNTFEVAWGAFGSGPVLYWSVTSLALRNKQLLWVWLSLSSCLRVAPSWGGEHNCRWIKKYTVQKAMSISMLFLQLPVDS